MCDEFSVERVAFNVGSGEPVMAPALNRGSHVRLLLGSYVLGGLTAQQEAAVRAHLVRCEACRVVHDELASVQSLLDLLTPEDLADDAEGTRDSA